ncbi:FG-GAP-like repeat-containing protein [Streptomyces sp. MRC013]|uniref:FG-GAP-like repeat-containing protein n=1 Tax=Streptomyces sp. MRC013 TaxID=2898276 RepID=UPI0020275C41|nr:FG-GAP-like repeat-containing protein [Streptomyces sp. MRC013]URM88732.1 FG-GAP-like repeat-containing protein [Streptomyces sp. MRC013]
MRIPVRRLVGSLAGLVVGGLVAATLPAQTAQAATGSYRCPAGYFCGFTGTSGDGTMFKTNTSMATLGTWDNRIRSYVNRSPTFACLYTEPHYSLSGDAYVSSEAPAGPGEYAWTPAFDRRISSVRLVRTERECTQSAYPRWYAETAPGAAGFGDLDGDRRSDVLVRDAVGRTWFLPGDGTGRLVGSGWNAMTALTRHGDFSGDGREDLLARDRDGVLWLYPGRGDGAFTTRRSVGSGWNAMNHLVGPGDLTGDGRADLLARDTGGRLWLYPGRGDGAFTTRRSVGSGWNAMNHLVGPGDLTGDGRADLLARDTGGRLWLYPGRGDGAFASRRLLGGGWNVMKNLVGVGSYDGDGVSDLLTVTDEAYRGGMPGWLLGYRGTGTGAFLRGTELDGDWWGLNGVH